MRRLVICSDGTWNTPEQREDDEFCPSNVVKLARAVRPQAADGTTQSVFYDTGVGTGPWLDRLTGGAFGHGLSRNVLDAYRFLVHNYEPGDQIWLFGFSRGAYTARSTAGLIRNCGLLHKTRAERIEEAYAMYRDRNVHPDDESARRFRTEHAHEPDIHFLGVWDTVGALGIPLRGLNALTRGRYEFHDVMLSRIIRHACQALAIDEQRGAFRPSLWRNEPAPGQQVEQVWFPGVHANIGGGYRDSGLSNLALHWMARKAAQAGLELDQSWLDDACAPDWGGELRESRRGLYRLLQRHPRPIGTAVGEAVHPGALRRYRDSGQAYAPDNLRDWLNRTDSPQAPQPA